MSLTQVLYYFAVFYGQIYVRLFSYSCLFMSLTQVLYYFAVFYGQIYVSFRFIAGSIISLHHSSKERSRII